jgi:hypothetical protein
MDEVPADVSDRLTTCGVARDPRANFIETTEFFDVDVDQFARPLAFIALDGGLWLNQRQPARAQPV